MLKVKKINEDLTFIYSSIPSKEQRCGDYGCRVIIEAVAISFISLRNPLTCGARVGRVVIVAAMVMAQIPNNLAMHLHDGGAKILGTTPDMIDNAEDRSVTAARRPYRYV